MKEILKRNRDTLTPREQLALWQAIRPASIERRRATTMRRWAVSFAVGAAAVVSLALFFRHERVETRSHQIAITFPEREAEPAPGGIAPEQETDADRRALQSASAGHFVDAAAESLAWIPIIDQTTSYARSRAFLADRVFPPRDVVRVEDFVSEFGSGLPDTGTAPLLARLDGCPSPFDPEARFLRVAIKAGARIRIVEARSLFDPSTVASYRLLASRPAAADTTEDPSGDREPGAGRRRGMILEPGAESVALFELRLRPDTSTGGVASVSVAYEDSTGTPSSVATGFTMADWLPSYDASTPGLRLSVAAAGFAELLRAESTPIARPSFADLARRVWQIASDTRGDPEVVRFALLVERAAEVEEALSPEQRWQWESGGLPSLPDRPARSD